ncbi:MAG TPA: hypothetical protein VK097_05630 [Lentibacillus sp.]|uniref:hypothetical protein n=1 Tax=Lentibacillus sp. TaxID=1925746 RepID=UPI002B4B8BE9|nr:hypothetical protein [Lentibacillus sp.]HLR61907.1 hypothetical protein [Lentibacillus sp.]
MTILLVYDYFPDIPFAEAVPLELLIVAMLVLFMVTVYRNRKHNPDQKTVFWSQVFFLVYVFALMTLLTALGGESQIGISFDKGIFWAALAITIMEISFQWRRMQQEE